MTLSTRTSEMLTLANALSGNYQAGKRFLESCLGDATSRADFEVNTSAYLYIAGNATSGYLSVRQRRHFAELLAIMAIRGTSTMRTAILIDNATTRAAILAQSVAFGWVRDNTTCRDLMFANSTAMAAVAASSTAMAAVIASSTAMAAVIASSTAMAAVIASSTARSAIAGSQTAMNAINAASAAIKTQICNSADMMTALRGSSYKKSAIATGALTKSLSVSGTQIILQLVANLECVTWNTAAAQTYNAMIGGTLVSGTAVAFSVVSVQGVATIVKTENEAAVYTAFTATLVSADGDDNADDFVCYYI